MNALGIAMLAAGMVMMLAGTAWRRYTDRAGREKTAAGGALAAIGFVILVASFWVGVGGGA
jgi:hypothetical protein